MYRVPSSWYDGVYSDEKECVDAARSFSILHEEADRAVLMVHGYAGYPGELESPAWALFEDGYDVFVPRLPGMGTSGKDFQNSCHSDWQLLVAHAIMDLTGRYSHVSIVGHSMGCPLALAASCGKRVEKMVLASPAFRLKQSAPTALLRTMKLMGKVLDQPWQSDPSYRMHYEGAPKDDGYLGAEYWSKIYPGCVLELKTVMKRGAEELRNTKAKLLFIAGGKDALVDFDSTELSRWGAFREVADGTHQLFYDPSESVEAETIALMREFLS